MYVCDLKGRKNLMIASENQVKKALVSIVIENSLLGIGQPIYEQVTWALKKQYRCYLPDCYEHPEYLTEILKKLFGESHRHIIKSINEQLEEFSHKERVEKFLEVINR